MLHYQGTKFVMCPDLPSSLCCLDLLYLSLPFAHLPWPWTESVVLDYVMSVCSYVFLHQLRVLLKVLAGDLVCIFVNAGLHAGQSFSVWVCAFQSAFRPVTRQDQNRCSPLLLLLGTCLGCFDVSGIRHRVHISDRAHYTLPSL